MTRKAEPLPRKLPPVKVRGARFACWGGFIGINAEANLIADAGFDVNGDESVSFAARASELTPEVRKKIAAHAIKLWNAFADGGER